VVTRRTDCSSSPGPDRSSWPSSGTRASLPCYRDHARSLRPAGEGGPAPTRTIDDLAPAFPPEVRRLYAAILPVLARRLQPAGGNVIAIKPDDEMGMLAGSATRRFCRYTTHRRRQQRLLPQQALRLSPSPRTDRPPRPRLERILWEPKSGTAGCGRRPRTSGPPFSRPAVKTGVSAWERETADVYR
jgi:hypothetical protein